MFMSIALSLHVLAIVVWVGGMFFAHQALRPAAVSTLEPPLRLQLWVATFKRFFPWVWVCVIIVLATGLWMMLQFPKHRYSFMHAGLRDCNDADLYARILCAV